MRLREPRLRDETGAEIDMTTGERKSTVVSVRADRLFPQLPAVVTGMEVKHGPIDEYGGCITLDMPAPEWEPLHGQRPLAVVPLPNVLLADGDSLSFSMEIDGRGNAHLLPPDIEDDA